MIQTEETSISEGVDGAVSPLVASLQTILHAPEKATIGQFAQLLQRIMAELALVPAESLALPSDEWDVLSLPISQEPLSSKQVASLAEHLCRPSGSHDAERVGAYTS